MADDAIADPEMVDDTPIREDALTIDEAIDQLQRMRLKSPEGGETLLYLCDLEPVCRLILTDGIVVVTDRFQGSMT